MKSKYINTVQMITNELLDKTNIVRISGFRNESRISSDATYNVTEVKKIWEVLSIIEHTLPLIHNPSSTLSPCSIDIHTLTMFDRTTSLSALLLRFLSLVVLVSSFVNIPTPRKLPECQQASRTAQTSTLYSSTDRRTTETPLAVPIQLDEMVRQVANAIKQAKDQGKSRQIVRILLPRDAANDQFGTFYEQEASSTATLLVPPDESWQGGIMQLYRAAAPTCAQILRQLYISDSVPPRIFEDRSIDESGVDGVGLFQSQDKSLQCFVQPTQELVDDYVVDVARQARPDQLIILLNPQWRQVDDALDSASKGEGFLSGLASFLGGKGATLKRLKETGFEPVYTLEGYVCRGCNVRLLQVLDSDWGVFYESDDDRESFVSIGTLPKANRPTYQQVDGLLIDAGVGFKYAKDIGL